MHGLAVKVSGHNAPLPTVGRSTLRVRDAVPPAHVTEHVAQLDQAPTMQSTACIEGEPDGTAVTTLKSVGVGVVGMGVGNGVGEGVGFDVGAGVGADIGAGVGLHAKTMCSMTPVSKSWVLLPVTCTYYFASPNADRRQSRCGVDQFRRRVSAVPA